MHEYINVIRYQKEILTKPFASYVPVTSSKLTPKHGYIREAN